MRLIIRSVYSVKRVMSASTIPGYTEATSTVKPYNKLNKNKHNHIAHGGVHP